MRGINEKTQKTKVAKPDSVAFRSTYLFLCDLTFIYF